VDRLFSGKTSLKQKQEVAVEMANLASVIVAVTATTANSF
jgi:hypothetical protein